MIKHRQILLLVVLSVLLYLLWLQQSQLNIDITPKLQPLVAPDFLSEIDTIVLERLGTEVIRFERRDCEAGVPPLLGQSHCWFSPVEGLVRQEGVSSLLKLVAQLSDAVVFPVSDGVGLDQLGLDHPVAALQLSSGSESLRLEIGGLNKYHRRYYGQILPGAKLVLLPEELKHVTKNTAAAWQEDRPLWFLGEPLGAFTITTELGQYGLQFLDGRWQLPEHPNWRLAQDQIGSLIRSWATLKASFIPLDQKRAKLFGKLLGTCRVEVQLAGDRQAVFHFSKPFPKDDDKGHPLEQILVRLGSSGKVAVGIGQPGTLPRCPESEGQLRDRRVFVAALDDVQVLEYRWEDGRVETLERVKEGWTFSNVVADGVFAREFVRRVLGLEVTGFLEPDESFYLRPELELKLALANGDHQSLELLRIYGLDGSYRYLLRCQNCLMAREQAIISVAEFKRIIPRRDMLVPLDGANSLYSEALLP